MNIVMIIFAIIVVCVIAWCLYDDSKKKKNLSCFMEGGFTGDDSEEIKQFIRKCHNVRYVPVPVTAEDFQRLESKIDNLQNEVEKIRNFQKPFGIEHLCTSGSVKVKGSELLKIIKECENKNKS